MKYAVKRYWEVCDTVEVEANEGDIAAIVQQACELDLTHGEYVRGSMNVDEDLDIQEITGGD